MMREQHSTKCNLNENPVKLPPPSHYLTESSTFWLVLSAKSLCVGIPLCTFSGFILQGENNCSILFKNYENKDWHSKCWLVLKIEVSKDSSSF